MQFAKPNPLLQSLRDAHNALVDQLLLIRHDPPSDVDGKAIWQWRVQSLKTQIEEAYNTYWEAKGVIPHQIRPKVTVDGVVQNKPRRGRPPGIRNGQGKRKPEPVKPVKRGRGRPKGSRNKPKG